jgi:hypothetical protein
VREFFRLAPIAQIITVHPHHAAITNALDPRCVARSYLATAVEFDLWVIGKEVAVFDFPLTFVSLR